MSLSPGTRLGSYEVTAKIGEGGMGEVYRATDTTLKRDVALKVLPSDVAEDPDRLMRSRREAEVLASLNHPHIAQIYGLEQTEGLTALVMELVEGDDLSQRIARGRIPLDEALAIARQIAEALEAAHEQGIIHRDLKPANVKVTPDGVVKVLDFGLAKALGPEPAHSESQQDQSHSPTLSARATQMGMIMGTAGYMSPEQARGLPVDKRADIWSFGVVLYEMLTGRRAFEGEDISLTLASVMKSDPDMAALPPDLPPSLRAILLRCLDKDPKRRIRDMGDVCLLMDGAFDSAPSAALAEQPVAPRLQVWQKPVPLMLSGIALFLIGCLAMWGFGRGEAAPAGSVTRLPFVLPEGDTVSPGHGMALSPDGSTLVYAGIRDGVQQLFVRRRDQMTVRPVPGSEDAVHPFFSPDGEWVGFFTGDALKKVALAGGPPLTLCAVGNRGGASWGEDDTIVFASAGATGLMQVFAAGGEPRPLTEAEPGTDHRWPSFVPGGEAVIYTIRQRQNTVDTHELAVVSRDTGETQSLVGGTDGAVTTSGHLVFGREKSLWAVGFDSERFAVTGEPAPMVEGAQVNSGGWALYAVADEGTLVYLPSVGSAPLTELVWLDREGELTPFAGLPGQHAHVRPRVSPDGARLVVDSYAQQRDLWVGDLTGEGFTRLTFSAAADSYGIWTPDGERVIFSSERAGAAALFWKFADGTGEAEPLGESEFPRYPMSVSPDGSVVVAEEIVGNNTNLITVSLSSDPVSTDLLATEFEERNANLSPDGRWFAYDSDASGVDQVYVRPFPDADSAVYQISTDGGTCPLWAPDGSELFYQNAGGLVAVPVQTTPSFSRGTTTVLFDARLRSPFPGRRFDIDPSDERFLVARPRADFAENFSLTFVLNWHRELEERVPVR